jgi:hypothetical protein
MHRGCCRKLLRFRTQHRTQNPELPQRYERNPRLMIELVSEAEPILK